MKGKKSIVLMFFLIVGSIVLGTAFWQWKMVGLITNKEENRIALAVHREPEIYTDNRKIKQGEIFLTKKLAKARDEKGQDISDIIIYKNEKGKVLGRKIDTTKPGIQKLTAWVQSPISGCKISRCFLVLVDGRVKK